MQGAREFASLFSTSQHGRLYIVSSSHARGKTFQIFVLPEGVQAQQNGQSNPCLNSDAVEVYGMVSGQRGWTETYGWLHVGRWQDDFDALVEERRLLRAHRESEDKDKLREFLTTAEQKKQALLATY